MNNTRAQSITILMLSISTLRMHCNFESAFLSSLFAVPLIFFSAFHLFSLYKLNNEKLNAPQQRNNLKRVSDVERLVTRRNGRSEENEETKINRLRVSIKLAPNPRTMNHLHIKVGVARSEN